MSDDVCKHCGCSLHVTGSKNVVKFDDTPERSTELYAVLTLACENPQCVSFGKPIDLPIRQEVQSGKGTESGGDA